MNKRIKIVSYVLTILFLVYLTLISGFDVLWHFLGGNIIYFHPLMPLTEEYVSEGTLMVSILLFYYVVFSGIYFIRIGWRGLKDE